ncbi:MAG: hypothetical protein LBT43_03015 [Prevotella sp.]|nr:hypothetical protein [Prevotella sp.]
MVAAIDKGDKTKAGVVEDNPEYRNGGEKFRWMENDQTVVNPPSHI